ncbi:MAG: hypothetical protein R3Y15_00920 [Rikenellaceae bacterium]
MIRKNLTNAVAAAAIKCGYSFFCGDAKRISRELNAVPAAWLTPIEAVGVSGVMQGEITYKVTLKLIEIDRHLDEQGKQEMICKMEQHAMSIYRELCQNIDVKSVSDLKWSPMEYVYTAQGEISLNISMLVSTVFCEQHFN